MKKPDRYTIIRYSGRADNCKDGADYFSVLESVFLEHSSAPGDWDAPNMLLLNGKIVVDHHLHDLAWKYCRERLRVIDEAAAAVREKHFPAWLKESEE